MATTTNEAQVPKSKTHAEEVFGNLAGRVDLVVFSPESPADDLGEDKDKLFEGLLVTS